MKALIFRAAAAADAERAHRWYEEQRSGLGEAFIAEVGACTPRIAENPLSCALRSRDVRRAPLRRFPHALFYRDTENIVIVVACFHVRQTPARLRDRR